MNDKLLLNLLGHLEDEQKALVAVTPDEIAELRKLGYVQTRNANLTDAGRAKLAELIAGR